MKCYYTLKVNIWPHIFTSRGKCSKLHYNGYTSYICILNFLPRHKMFGSCQMFLTWTNFILDRIQSQEVDKFKYLGSIMYCRRRKWQQIGKATIAFISLNWYRQKKPIFPLRPRLILYCMVCRNAYHAVTELDKLKAFRIQCLHHILGVYICYRLFNETIWHSWDVVCQHIVTHLPNKHHLDIISTILASMSNGLKVQRSAPKNMLSKQI